MYVMPGAMVSSNIRPEPPEPLVEQLRRQNQLILNAVGQGVFGVDAAGNTTFVNAAAEQLLGWTAAQLIGKQMHDLIHYSKPDGTVYPREACPIFESIRDGTVLRVTDEVFWRKDSTSFPVEYTSTPLRENGERQGAVVTFEDITERKRREQESQRRADEFAALYELSRELAIEQDVGTLLQTIVERATTLLHAPGGSIFLYDPAHQELEIAVVKGPEFPLGTRFQLGEGMAGRVAQTLVPLIVDDYGTWEHRSPQYRDVPITASVEVPMLYRGELIGVLAVNETQVGRTFTGSDAQLLWLLAGQAASAVHNARLLEQTRQRAQQLALLYDAGLTLNRMVRHISPDDSRPPLEFLFQIALKALRADRAEFFRFDPAHNELRYELGVRVSEAVEQRLRELKLPVGGERSLVSWVANHRLPVNLPDVREDPYYVTVEPKSRSGVWVPVEHEDRLHGVLVFLSDRIGAFTQDDERLLVLFANQAAVALENARLFAEANRRLKHLQSLRAIDLAITSSLDLPLTLNLLLEQVTTQLHVDAADVLLCDPHRQVLEYAAGHGFRTNALQFTRLHLGAGLAGRAALERRIVYLPDLKQDASTLTNAPRLPQEDFVVYVGVPLIAKGQVNGVLEIFHRSPFQPDPEWLDFAEALAGQAAIAIDNAELFQSLQRSNLELALAYDTTLEGWSRALDLRDRETEGHTQRVTDITVRVARAMGMSESELVHLRRGALLHDIGKMGIPDQILFKPGPLTEEEWAIMRKHPVYAYELLSPIAFLRPVLDVPYCHHEKWDGTGYPRGLKNGEIPLSARIFAVVDVWDALRSDRPYRPRWPETRVREYLREQSGSHFDPTVVSTFLQMEL